MAKEVCVLRVFHLERVGGQCFINISCFKLDCKILNNGHFKLLVAADPHRGPGTDPEPLGLVFHHLGPSFINAYINAYMGVAVQWFDYLAVTQEPSVRFPATAEKCISCGAALVDMG